MAAGGFRAQDYDAHVGFLERGLTGRWYLKGLTNPPFLYLFAAAMVRLVGWGSALSLVAATFALLNAVSLVILWRCAARVLSLRGSLLVTTWIATLPAFVTTAVVFAADALDILPFTLFCYLNLRLLEAVRPSAALLVASSIAQIAGCLSKYRIHRRRAGGVRDGRRPGVHSPAPPGVGGGRRDVGVRVPHGGRMSSSWIDSTPTPGTT